MEKSNTSERLRFLLRERKLKQVDILELAKPFCKKYGVKLNKNDLSQYVSGKVKPGQEKLSILGLALNVSEAWLMGYDVPITREPYDIDVVSLSNQFNNINQLHKKRIPMLGDIACGEPIYADEKHESYVMADMDVNADFCLTAKGDSMINARINDGDIVFIKNQPMVDNGEIAAVIIDNEATLKRVYYYPEENKIILNPENSKYPPFVYTNEELNTIRILGKAVYFMSTL